MPRFAFEFGSPLGLPLQLTGLGPRAASVRVEHGMLDVRFGLLRLKTPLSNIADATVTGPYNPLKVLGVRVSLADYGLTFGTSTRHGVCIQFVRPVSGVVPMLTHTGLTVTVAEPERLRDTLLRERDGGRSESDHFPLDRSASVRPPAARVRATRRVHRAGTPLEVVRPSETPVEPEALIEPEALVEPEAAAELEAPVGPAALAEPEALAEPAAPPASEPEAVSEPSGAASTPASRGPRPVAKRPAKQAPAKKAAVKKAPVKKAPVKKATVQKAPVKKAPVKKSVPDEAASPEAPTAADVPPGKRTVKLPAKKTARRAVKKTADQQVAARELAGNLPAPDSGAPDGAAPDGAAQDAASDGSDGAQPTVTTG